MVVGQAAATFALFERALQAGARLRAVVVDFFRACCHGALAVLAGKDGSVIPAAQGAAQAEEAMAILRRAVALLSQGHRWVEEGSDREPPPGWLMSARQGRRW